MPSTKTPVNDLYAGRIHGIGKKTESTLRTSTSTLSAQYKIKYLNINVKISLSEGNPPIRLICDKATGIDINGTYLHFADGWSTITKIDNLRPIVVNGNFSGCAYRVYKRQGGIYCYHCTSGWS